MREEVFVRRTKKEEEEKHERDTQRKREDNKEKEKRNCPFRFFFVRRVTLSPS
jgi:hypothetical protein